ncbi:MAG: hypothetical protein ACM3WU_01210 [Bacillota bacterium]
MAGMFIDANYLFALGKAMQIIGVVAVEVANVTNAKRTGAAVDEAEQRIASLKQELAQVELQVQRARRGLSSR